MRFLYKIYSNFDGFRPTEIPNRMLSNSRLRLGWARYIDEVSIGDEVWIYFYGRHSFTHGVYAKGFVRTIDPEDAGGPAVFVKITQFQTNTPLTDAEASRRVARAVSTWYRQVFLFPEEWDIEEECKLQSSAETCEQRQCDNCRVWRRLPRIVECGTPSRLSGNFSVYAPAYWLIPKRCYLRDDQIKPGIRRTSQIFSRFKTGEKALAYPLALAIYETLKKKNALEFDCITPIPLSPDKIASKELHRTKTLAVELSRLIGVPVADVLSLTTPISKRRGNWTSAHNFEAHYYQTLQVDEKVRNYERILLVDDACTRGSTLECARRKILEIQPKPTSITIGAATAGQMIVVEIMTPKAQEEVKS